MIEVFIVDDHAVVREGIKQILGETPDIKVTGEAATALDALEKIKKKSWDVIVLDIFLPDRSGLDVLKQIKSQYPDASVLILTMHDEKQYAARVLKAGASGFLTKESAPEQLIAAIQKVAGGGKYLSDSMAEKILVGLTQGNLNEPHENLSDREFQVMCMMASGKSIKEISTSLCLSVKTVSTYRSRILQKMGMNSNAELTHYAIQNKIV